MRCPCGSDRPFDQCCGPYLSGDENPPTAEALMRARYTAYTRQDLDFIARTFAPETRANFDAPAAKAWAAQSQWLGLQIVAVDQGGPEDRAGAVEFIASYRQGAQTIQHHELSRFRRGDDGRWLFTEGETRFSNDRADKPQPKLREGPKAGRNDPCPCGSGKKYKKCCGA